jgi:carbon-monoxide dehydrogenase medium subunit
MSVVDLLEPATLEDAVAALGADGSRALAGGTALVQVLRLGLHDIGTLVSLRRVPRLAGIAVDGDDLVIGAMTTLWDVAESATVRALAPGLAEAVAAVGNPRIRAMGTLGGNLCHGDPRCDPPIALLALGARAVVDGPAGRRSIPLAEFFVGYYQTAPAPGELLIEIRVPRPAAGTRAVYLRYTFGSEEDWPCVAVAAVARVADGRLHGLRVALAGVADRPLLVAGLEPVVPAGAARDVAERAAAQAEPVSDLRGTEGYKREMVRVHTRRALERLAAASRG